MHKRRVLVLSTLVIFAAILVILAITKAVRVPQPSEIKTEHYPQIGKIDAPITMVVFEDFLCRTCRYFNLEVFPAIQTTYIDTGLVKYVMIPLAFSSNSKEIANAAYFFFYQAPHHYFTFVQEVFSQNKKLEIQDLIQLASQFPGVGLTAFVESIKLGKYDQELENNLAAAKKAMKNNLHTPAVFINGELNHGISFESLSGQIESIKERL